ncbi:alpha/beta hydrolase [Staphylococcus saccharolyticus]|uniref:alpha/beta hydrolase fold domain-containing protein n=1 Tax=Staphylococcus saccharolyticus TaxID=33028 RepID=UPI00102DBF13|nr:alpha/beta hydrolase [Staphylococcus saccharolyticus]MBL7573635.1 alpha/beta hydrolase [Staphylococcus saccharolyticus]MBL7584575.1 alpha/beta hydrolase [Staphylococcus saccharolyticus]MBL7639436.1 alpha/beta hydrolase [Staphylococcus saccharolyticus]QRJ68753.1 alpha/beta hydrolase [Staphylococcus saccharolyticus]TAA92071.1 esterase [Staphylococcus saccharolyticus]
MRNKMMNRVVNKYILHNRSIFFKNNAEVEHFLEKRKDENSEKQKQPATLNVKSNIDKLTLDGMQVFRFNFRHETRKKILYLHGGYNVLQPSPFHWRLLDKLTLNTLHEVVLPIYPKAPEYHIDDTYQAIRKVYNQLVDEVGTKHIVVMGDGSGGGLALRLVQTLIEEQQSTPKQLFLISPLLDATLSNPNITQDLVEKDILVSKYGVNELMKVWANDLPLSDKRVSPIYGEIKGLPPVYTFGGVREINNPDMNLFAYLLEEQGQFVDFKEYSKMVHDFPIYPIRQSHKVLKQITKAIQE